jgi:N-acetylneuraminic acid mutarotase
VQLRPRLGYSYETYDLATAELYNPTTRTWSPTGSLKNARFSHTATLLLDGRVLLAGGYNGLESMTSVEIYDPRRDRWTTTGSLHVGREEHMATLLQDGKVLVTGGYGDLVGEITALIEKHLRSQSRAL